jgi:hypothetical protein
MLKSVTFESGSIPTEMHPDAFVGCLQLDIELLGQTGST